MFTGLVQDVGTVESTHPEGRGARLTVRTALDLADFEIGESVAVDGVCLTVESVGGACFVVTAGSETLACSTAGTWRPGRRVHLERALRVGDRLGGHWVQGHVDGRATCVGIVRDAESVVLRLSLPEGLSRYVVPKGSIAIDGISLTVNEVDGPRIRLNIIPHTWSRTHLGELRAGDSVNVEADVLARYLERLTVTSAPAGGLDLDRLRQNGFL